MVVTANSEIKPNSYQEFEFPTPYVRLDKLGNIQILNKSAKRLLGVSPRQKGELHISELISKSDIKRFLKVIGIIVERGRVNEFVFKDKEETTTIIFDADVLKDKTEKAVGVHGMLFVVNKASSHFELDKFNAIEFFPHALALILPDGRIKVNNALLILTALTEEQLALQHIPCWLKKLNECSTKPEREVLVKLETKEFRVSRFLADNGRTDLEFLQVIPNNHHRKRNEFVPTTQSTLEHLINVQPIGLLIENANGKVVFISDGFLEMFFINENKTKLYQLNFDALLSKACPKHTNIDALIDLCDTIRAKKESSIIEHFQCTDNSLVLLEFTNINYSGESLKAWSFKKNDLPVDRLTIDPYRRNLFASLVDNCGIGWLEIGDEGRIIRASRAFRKITGYYKTELLGVALSSFFAASCKNSKTIIERAFCGEVRHDKVIFEKKNGGTATMSWVSDPYQHNSQEQKGFFVILFDDTELQFLRKQNRKLSLKLEEHVRSMREYSHVIAHDFKTPLQNIHALVTWLKQDFGSGLCPEINTSLDLVMEKSERVEVLLEDILRYVEIDYRKKSKSIVDLNWVLNSIIHRLEIPSNIKISIPDKLPTLKINPDLIEQLFENLIVNAVSSMNKEHGAVVLTHKEKPKSHEFSIKDNGAGIPKEYLDDIFSIFQSFSGSGTGLGLSIVKKIVERHHGSIWLESEMGIGSTFHFTIKKY